MTKTEGYAINICMAIIILCGVAVAVTWLNSAVYGFGYDQGVKLGLKDCAEIAAVAVPKL